MHKIDEQASVRDIEQLAAVYARILEIYFAEDVTGGGINAA